MRLTGEQYDALVLLMRGDANSPSNKAARRVLVDGITQLEARTETGVQKNTVSNAVRRYANAGQLMASVFSK